MTLQFRNSTDQEYTHTVILLNQENEETGAREFTNVIKDDDSLLYQIISTAGSTGDLVTFVDIDENGRLDVIVQKFDQTTQAPTLVVLYNGVITDNFFMKALFVNSQQTKSQNIYTDNAIGVSYRFVITDMGDKKLVVVGSQNYQQGYNNLQLPYAFIGVGRSNNYIETFYAATSIMGKRAIRMWTPIIPNS